MLKDVPLPDPLSPELQSLNDLLRNSGYYLELCNGRYSLSSSAGGVTIISDKDVQSLLCNALDYVEFQAQKLYAVNSLRAGDDIKTVQDNMGHHTAAFTPDTYGHVTAQMKEDSSQRMQSYIDRLK